jgi:hypothetical protein
MSEVSKARHERAGSLMEEIATLNAKVEGGNGAALIEKYRELGELIATMSPEEVMILRQEALKTVFADAKADAAYAAQKGFAPRLDPERVSL